MVALLALVGPAEASPGTLLDEQRKLQVRESRDQELEGRVVALDKRLNRRRPTSLD
jgi:hypothetical protein